MTRLYKWTFLILIATPISIFLLLFWDLPRSIFIRDERWWL